MKKHVHKTIANKLFWSLALFFTICFVIVTISISLLFQNEVDGIRKTETSRVTGYYSENFNKVINEMETICNIIGNNYDIQQMIRKNPPDNKKEYLKERCDINGRLALLVQSYTDVPYEIAFFLDDGRSFSYARYSLERDAEIQQAQWYKDTKKQERIWSYGSEKKVFNSLVDSYMSLQIPMFNIKTNQACGVIYVALGIDDIRTLFSEVDTGYSIQILSGSEVLIELGSIIENKMRGENKEQKELDNGWLMKVCLGDYSSMISDETYIFYFILLFLLLFSVFMIINFYFRRYITKPIMQLSREMKHLKMDSLTKPLQIRTSLDEVTTLTEGYNRMLKRIQNLLENVRQEQIENQKAQYAVLQAQINPHFLYNTLDTITWQIRTGETEKALKNLMDFSKYFRLSLSKGRQFISLESELEHTRIYLSLMSVRYLGQITYSIDCQTEEILSCQCPKLILQPIVENSVNHGILKKKSQSGVIAIAVQKVEQDIWIDIRDDGIGIAKEELECIREKLRVSALDYTGAEKSEGKAIEKQKKLEYSTVESQEDWKKKEDQNGKGYGIININRRIELLYGKRYGIQIFSVEGEYTLVRVTLPVKEGEVC